MEIQLNILSPEKKLFEGGVAAVILPTPVGEIGILADHAPLIGLLGPGPVKYQTRPGADWSFLYFVEGGFFRIEKNAVIVLASKALQKEQIDAQSESEKLSGQLRGVANGDLALDERERNIAISRAKIKFAS